MGAKNHAISMPDASIDATLNSLIAVGFGAAGQICMALSVAADSLEEAMDIVNKNKYGNGASIFTTSGIAARKFQNDIEAGQDRRHPLQATSISTAKRRSSRLRPMLDLFIGPPPPAIVAVFESRNEAERFDEWCRAYKETKFKNDLMAGLTLASLSIPQVQTKTKFPVLRFSLVSVSGYRVDHIVELAHQRLSTILIGGLTCVLISVGVCPVWAGEELHNLVATNLEKLGEFLQSRHILLSEGLMVQPRTAVSSRGNWFSRGLDGSPLPGRGGGGENQDDVAGCEQGKNEAGNLNLTATSIPVSTVDRNSDSVSGHYLYHQPSDCTDAEDLMVLAAEMHWRNS
ncbi:hypothetical protein Syun_016853 [Stephania yunnanensis]|uniref:methylmalonate-semialdehyde dehydrogenase (CoA acylating) n=1 Tax=Stephania yunnanensis TaxID=152371 RepID=A0AAP0J859_9MAGN